MVVRGMMLLLAEVVLLMTERCPLVAALRPRRPPKIL